MFGVVALQIASAHPAVVEFVSGPRTDGVLSISVIRAARGMPPLPAGRPQTNHGLLPTDRVSEPLCDAPCTTSLPPGKHELSLRDDSARWTQTIRIHEGAQRVTLTAANPKTGALALVLCGLIVGLPVGVPMLIASMPHHHTERL